MHVVNREIEIETTPSPDTTTSSQSHTSDRSILLAAKGGGVSFAGSIFAYGIRLILGIWLARLLGAEQFGFTAEGIDAEDGIRQIRITTAMPRTMCRTMFLLWAALGHVVYS